ncbi:NAD(P)/FAD-dependent oxidoreductase [Dongia soli]|uniref:NAD(P)/FAD-dependent oxidoreductase n=1 Tax=Dongia soli TaxID=600628 RepID=A0ABU5E7N8_9PROT|nr:NAD(P)/FAD-dependent oxidoreductase [Dongia soli]MDY0881568.1 NAD(P)/FAD-dependent oxidoreductase [Dongia soli]
MDEVECVVVGAGVVGLAIARGLACQGREVLGLEAAPIIGSETSSRNSEVIHAGIYYAKGSLKARLCLAGRDALYDFCASRAVPHARLGKLIVASHPAQLGQLDAIAARAAANGVDNLRFLDAAEIGKMEPALKASGGLLSPSTGIIDSHAFMLALQGDAENAGATFAFRTPVLRGEIVADGYRLETGGDMPMQLKTKYLVNAAGHGAWDLARRLRGYPEHLIPNQALAKGNYFTLQGRSPFQRLIYPVPEPGGLGIHLTIDLGGRARFGPDVEWVGNLDYRIDPTRADRFYPAIRRYWPDLPDGALEPAYTGIRPKLVGPGEGDADFRIDGPIVHGQPGLVQLFGIESPGLTASLAIGALVAQMLSDS